MSKVSIRAIDYNAWLSLIKLVADETKILAKDYGLSGMSIDVLPAYPRDLSDYHKPAIIIQKVDVEKHPLGFGGFIGQFFDSENNAYIDAFGVNNEITLQVDINADNNSICALLTSLIADDILLQKKFLESGSFKLYDFIPDDKNPIEAGVCRIMGDLDIVVSSANDNNDYTSFIRLYLSIVQVVIPDQDLVDLSKGIKYKQTIKL